MKNNLLKSIFYVISFCTILLSIMGCINNSNNTQTNEFNNNVPSGKIIEGIRVVNINKDKINFSIYVFRGETVRLLLEKRNYDYSVHIPDFNLSKDSIIDKELSIELKAKTIGVFPIFCNGNCPYGDGIQAGKIIVMEYESDQGTFFKNVTAKEAKEIIEKDKPFILDVRTPTEFYSGYIPGAKLIPVQQLAERISEIEEFKDKDVLVYCRSGNRSIVAAEILEVNGFKKIYNLSSGIRGWINEGFKVVK